jgi:hypothetical protein
MPGDVVQRTQRTGREQRVTGPKQEPGIRRLPLGEPLDQRRLADAGLARQQDDPAARRRGQHAAQLLQQRRALEQVHHNATLRLAASTRERASRPCHLMDEPPALPSDSSSEDNWSDVGGIA